MTPQQRTILRNYALATLGAGAVAVSLYFGGFDPDTGRPDPITVEGEAIEFTWTDDNTDENLIIYTDQQNYENGFSNAAVYVAVTNQSGVDQDVSLMGSFVNQRRYVKDVSVLTEATFAATSTEKGNCTDLTGKQLQSQIDSGKDPADYYITEYTPTTTPRTFEVCTKLDIVSYSTSTEWVALPQTKRDIYEVAVEEGYLNKLNTIRKTVDGYVAENKTISFPIKAGQTMYYKLDIEYPANDSGNFFLEAVGSEGAYGHLDPWFDAAWSYRVPIEVNPSYVSGSSNLTSFPVYLDLSDLPAAFHTNVKTDGCDIRVVESDETTETPFELVEYDSTGDTGELHLLVDTLSYTATTTFYVYYGNSGASCYSATDTYGRNAVWANYVAVYHFNDDPSGGSMTDATGNGYTGTAIGSMTAGDLISGGVGNAWDFDGSNDGVETNSNASAFQLATMSITTVSYVPSGSAGRLWFVGTQGSAYSKWNGQAGVVYRRTSATTGPHLTLTTSLADDSWHHTAYTGTSGGHYAYLDGSDNGNDTDSRDMTGMATADAVSLGGNWFYNGSRQYSTLKQSELRYFAGTLTSDWIATESNNLMTPTPFYWVGAEESNASSRRIIRSTMTQ